MSKAIVLVLAWNGERFLDACLTALRAQQYDDQFGVLVIDNASTDDSIATVRRYPEVVLLQNTTNLGFAGGNNAGLRALMDESATPLFDFVPDFVVLLNQDTEVAPDWLAQISQAFERHPQSGVVGCKCLYSDGHTLQHAGGVISWPTGTGTHRGVGEVDQGQFDQEEAVEFVTGAAFAIRRDLLATVGLLDDGFTPAYFEDPDYCYRARAAGYDVIYAPAAHLIHHEGTSLTLQSARHQRAYHRNRVRFVLKHGALATLTRDWLPAECEEIVRWSTNDSLARKQAYLDGILALPRLLAARTDVTDVGATYTDLSRILRRMHQAVIDEERAQRSKSGYELPQHSIQEQQA